uniref:Meprin and TRAF homology domain-containing protein / MATH domain-containing protein n=1 Tax=Solanum tuberosum TaxID=4113 RepID=M1DLP6_SOLTU
MIIHPDGYGDGARHISEYLAIIGTSSLHAAWEVNASFSFLIFDQIHDNYNVIKDSRTKFVLMQEWRCVFAISRLNGVPQNVSLIKHSKIPLMVNYLVNDKCIFGVDVYVIKNQGIGECMSLLNGTPNLSKHEWKITEFSKLKNEVYYFEEFTVDGYKWKRSLYPTGDSKLNGQNISVFLESVDAKRFDRQKCVRAKFSISVKNRNSGCKHNKMMELSMENITNSLPTRYLLKIESFSLLLENGISKYESNEFESGGFNWKMIIHPNGDGDGDGAGHISIYLAVIGASLLHSVHELNASFSFLIVDQIHDNFTVMKGGLNWYSAATDNWGWPSFMPCCEFNDPKKGFLIEDCCIVEAEVSVVGVVNCLT